jgi:hypothetical protein
MTLAGGLLDRAIEHSFRAMVRDAITALGHTAPGRAENGDTRRNDYAVHILGDRPGEVDARFDITQPMPRNAIGITLGARTTRSAEMGSDLAEHRIQTYLEWIAESRSYGKELTGDLVAILAGRMPGTARAGEDAFPVYDPTVYDPLVDPPENRPGAPELYVAIEDVGTDEPPNDGQLLWQVVTCDLIYEA